MKIAKEIAMEGIITALQASIISHGAHRVAGVEQSASNVANLALGGLLAGGLICAGKKLLPESIGNLGSHAIKTHFFLEIISNTLVPSMPWPVKTAVTVLLLPAYRLY